jgi:hypothetical protein
MDGGFVGHISKSVRIPVVGLLPRIGVLHFVPLRNASAIFREICALLLTVYLTIDREQYLSKSALVILLPEAVIQDHHLILSFALRDVHAAEKTARFSSELALQTGQCFVRRYT